MDDFRFNDDLLLHDDERADIKKCYPSIAFALSTPELRQRFSEIDRKSKIEKRRFRIFGFIAVGLATAALSLAAFESMILTRWADNNPEAQYYLKQTAMIAASAGLISILIGWGGMGIHRRKHAWLEWRLLAERLRHWQWQYVLAHIDEIVSAVGSETLQDDYVRNRDREFPAFYTSYRGQIAARLNEHLDESNELAAKIWLDPEFKNGVQALENPDTLKALEADSEKASSLRELLRAYGRIRMQGQIDYISYLLGPGPFATHPAKQQRVLESLSHACVALIAGFHVAVLAGIVLEIDGLTSPSVYICVIILALIALALRVVEEGLRSTEEVVRLRGYLNEMVSAKNIFETGDNSAKLQSMRTLEDAASRELIDFLQSANVARYVM